MSDQVATKQVTWEDLEVAEEQDLNKVTIHDGTEWEEGNEPVPTEMTHRKNVSITVNVSLDEYEEAIGKFWAEEIRNTFLIQVAQAFRVPPSAIVNTNVLPEDIADLQERVGSKMENLRLMYGGGGIAAPPCTAHRNPITRYEGDCSDGS